MWSQKSWQMNVQWIIILLILDFLLVFQLLPMMHLVVKAFTPNGTFSLDTFKRLYEYQMNWGALTNTIIAALATMALGTLLAFPLAWLVGRTNLYGRQFFRKLFVVTYMVPPYVGAMAWLRLLNPNVGIINQALRAVFNLNTTVGPLNVYSLGGMIWVLTSFYFPYAFITISRAMEKMDPSLEEASRVSGASPLTTVARVTLPMMTPSLIAGALLVFVSAASCYGIPSIIGAPGKVHTVTTRIIEYYGRGTQGLNDATGLAVFLMLMALLILYLSDFVLAKKQYVTVSGKSTRPNIVELRSWRKPLTALVTLVAVIIVLIPFTTILTTSFKIDVGKSVLAAGNFTWGQWETIFSRGETLTSLKNSLIFASIAATVGILIACTMSYLLQRTRIKGRRLPDFLITLGSGTPSVVIALGLIMTMQGGYGVNIYNTAYILIVAYLIKYLLMGMRTVVSAMSQIHVSLEESSTISGAGWLKTMGRITGPLIFPSIAAGWFLIFIPCFYELSMTTLLYSNTTKTIGFQLYEYWTYTSQPQACAMAFGILMVVVLLNLLLNRLTRGEFSI
ncbi:MAG: iron ABC transporter permease [Clostridiales bacterium]|nr:iron ABC transporter permease [Clostridiales bacterium]